MYHIGPTITKRAYQIKKNNTHTKNGLTTRDPMIAIQKQIHDSDKKEKGKKKLSKEKEEIIEKKM
jgi:hypothetical protein